VVKGLWLTAIDSGVYLANGQYYPHTRWLARGLSSLKEDFGMRDFTLRSANMDLSERIPQLKRTAGKISGCLVEKGLLERAYQDDPWWVMGDEYFIFSTF